MSSLKKSFLFLLVHIIATQLLIMGGTIQIMVGGGLLGITASIAGGKKARKERDPNADEA